MKPSKKKPPPPKTAAKKKQKPESSPGHLKPSLLGLYGVVGMTLSVLSLTTVKLPFAESFAKEYWRHALAGLLLILAAVAALIGVAISMLDADIVKAQVIDYVKTHKQRDLRLEGDIDLTFFPKLGLDCGKLTLSERNSKEKFASVDNARLYVAWWPLLRRQLRIEQIALDGVQANLTRHKDGSTNFDDLLSADGRLSSVMFAIERVRVFDSTVHLRDAGSGLQISVKDLDLETGHIQDRTPSEMKASFQLLSAHEKLDTRVNLAAHLLFDRAADRFEISNITAHAIGHSTRVTGLDADLKASVTAYPASQRFELSKLLLTLQGEMAQHKLDSRLEVDRLLQDRERLTGSGLNLQTHAARNADSFAGTLDVPAFELIDNRLQAPTARASVDWSSSGRQLNGQLSSPMSWQFKSRTLHLPTLEASLSADHPALRSRLQLRGSGELISNWVDQSFLLNFRATLDDSELSGKVQVKDFAKPATSFDLVANTLDLDRYLAIDWSKRLAPDAAAFDFSALDKLQMRGKFHSSGEFRIARLKTRELSSEILLDAHGLQLDDMQAQLYGGQARGSLTLRTGSKPNIQLRQKLAGIQLDALLNDLLGAEPRLHGQGDLSLDLRADASQPAALRRTLSGSASLALSRGSLAGINLHEALVAGKHGVGQPGEQYSETGRETEHTAFTELKATFDIERGRARNPDLLLKSASFTSKGEGEIAIASGDINYRVNTTVAAGLRRGSGSELADLAGITVPASISATPDSSRLTLHLGEASGRRLAELARRNKTKR